jgi:hypothetical protein
MPMRMQSSNLTNRGGSPELHERRDSQSSTPIHADHDSLAFSVSGTQRNWAGLDGPTTPEHAVRHTARLSFRSHPRSPLDLFPLDPSDPEALHKLWPTLCQLVAPFELDRREYGNVTRYPPSGCKLIELHPRLAARLLDACGGSARLVSAWLVRSLGFEVLFGPADPDAPLVATTGRASTPHDYMDEEPLLVRPVADHNALQSPQPSRTTSASNKSRSGGQSPAFQQGGRGVPIGRATSGSVDTSLPLAPSTSSTMPASASASTNAPRVLFEDEGSPIDRIRELEAEVRELSRQLRTFQADRRSSQTNSPTSQVVINNCRPGIVAAGVATTVRVTVSALDADFAPYSIKIGRSIVPCVVTDRRVLSFVTPMLPSGSTPLQVMCTTAQGSVRRYGRAVWIESKPLRGSALAVASSAGHVPEGMAHRQPERLTRHAVNQLAPEVPLPSGSTMRDPSETGRTSMVESTAAKSEYDDTTDTESNTAVSEVRVPLTREMLDMFSGRHPRGAGGSDTASEAVTSTIFTLHVNSLAPPDTLSQEDAEERTLATTAAVEDGIADDTTEATATEATARQDSIADP